MLGKNCCTENVIVAKIPTLSPPGFLVSVPPWRTIGCSISCLQLGVTTASLFVSNAAGSGREGLSETHRP